MEKLVNKKSIHKGLIYIRSALLFVHVYGYNVSNKNGKSFYKEKIRVYHEDEVLKTFYVNADYVGSEIYKWLRPFLVANTKGGINKSQRRQIYNMIEEKVRKDSGRWNKRRSRKNAEAQVECENMTTGETPKEV